MKKLSGVIFGTVVLLGIAASLALSQNGAAPAATNGFPWGTLREGQSVDLGGSGTGFSYIRVYDDPTLEAKLRYRVKEIHPDVVVVSCKSTPDENFGDADIYVPLHAIHSVTVVKMK